ncbi:flagellar assembly protein A [Saccharibacillus qingshengii]|uniref:flagellar assembly protein A n=1 Tax=Saccharibacillus qingshengii TaxID=1763540 RepID=UPI0015571381|nr:FapA family protein [Saccharibacillus qingshengii]
MERSIITRAKSAETAVEEALKLLAVNRESVQIEIIEPGGRGLLGLGSRLAVVKVTVLQMQEGRGSAAPDSAAASPGQADQTLSAEAAAFSREEQPTAAPPRAAEQIQAVQTKPVSADAEPVQQGEIGIENGVFRIVASGDRLPLLTAPAGAVLYKNGVPVEGRVSVSREDRLELESKPQVEPAVWRIEIDDFCLRAELHIQPGFETRYTLIDCKPQTHLSVPVQASRTLLPVSEAEVAARLKEMGVLYGIRPAEIKAACFTEHAGVYTVAEGSPAVQGTNGSFEMNFETETKHLGPKNREDGTIDYREIVEFPTVVEGDVLVRTLPAKPGRPGRDLMDRPIQPNPVHPIQLAAGEGVSVTEDGRRAVAIRSGMPRVKHQAFRVHLSVLPKLSHRGDVDLKSGNIRFHGDVEISGGIQNGMKVESFGSLAVRGAVGSATIDAAYSLIASGSLIGAQVNVGKRNEFVDQAEPMLLEIASQTLMLQSAIEQLSQTAAFKLNDLQQTGLGALLNVLLRGKFKTLHAVLVRFSEQAGKNEAQLDEEWAAYATRLKTGFLDLRLGGFRNASELDLFRRRTLELYESLCGPEDRPIFADIQYAQNSHLYCGGSVRVAKGCYNTTLYCQGTLDSGGTLRGGVYFAGKGINVKEVGAHGGVATKLQVSEKASIKVGNVMEGTIVQIGRRSFQFIEAASNVHGRLGPSGELLLF